MEMYIYGKKSRLLDETEHILEEKENQATEKKLN